MDDSPFEHEHRANPFIPGNGPECMVCPFCLVLYGVRQARPEVMEHLQKAALEMVMAVKAMVDQAADKMERDSLHRIPVR